MATMRYRRFDSISMKYGLRSARKASREGGEVVKNGEKRYEIDYESIKIVASTT